MIAPGVPHALAQWRATRYRDVTIAIDAAIDRHARALRGKVTITVDLARPGRIVLDWKPARSPGAVRLRVNGMVVAGVRPRDEHLILDASFARAGLNTITTHFRAPIAASGRALVRWQDPDDGQRYVYTLFVPAEARTVFPCFDQPDLKARVTLTLTTPAGWQSIGNAPVLERRRLGARVRHVHATTEPISTYLIAFAAGPFRAIVDRRAPVPSRLWMRRTGLAPVAAAETLAIAREGTAFLARWLAAPFPFAKHDLVAIPGFPFGGMEHAGATFLREDAVLLHARASATQRSRRRQLVLHETAHQWMGDALTMRWFDDLWLKEGFANFLAAKALESAGHREEARAMLGALKESALAADATPGAVPVHQPLENLNAAKSLYGPTVYGKAPAVLLEAERWLGATRFRSGVRALVRRYPYGAFDRHDLVQALEAVGGHRLGQWAGAWIDTAGAPTLSLGRHGGRAVLRKVGPHPMRVDVLVRGRSRPIALRVEGRTTPLPRGAQGVLIDPRDASYARIRTDATAARALLAGRPRRAPDGTADRAWQAMRDGVLPPLELLDHLLARLERFEHVDRALARIEMILRRHLAPPAHAQAVVRAEERLLALGHRRTYAACAASAQAIVVLLERSDLPSLARLVQLGVLDPATAMARLESPPPDASAMLHAAVPDRRAKIDALSRLSHRAGAASDATVERVLPWLAAPEHGSLLQPLLPRALRGLARLRATRSIFIVNRWVDAFAGSQSERGSVVILERLARRYRDAPELQRKLVDAASELARTLRIRERTGTT